ncbi:hypothetical protein V1504DRAFT_54082 [Lipomyces starkeyi]
MRHSFSALLRQVYRPLRRSPAVSYYFHCSPPKMPLLDLANKLLQSIAECLGLERDINAFTQTNRRLYILLNPYLYRHNIQQL